MSYLETVAMTESPLAMAMTISRVAKEQTFLRVRPDPMKFMAGAGTTASTAKTEMIIYSGMMDPIQLLVGMAPMRSMVAPRQIRSMAALRTIASPGVTTTTFYTARPATITLKASMAR